MKSKVSMMLVMVMIAAVLMSIPVFAAQQEIKNDTVWLDTSGNEIKAQGGNILKVGSTYYWYGAELGTQYGPTIPDNFKSIKCYSSTDLVNWTFQGNVFTPSTTSNVDTDDYVLRPTVIYNSSTSQYVMIVMWKPINEYNPSRNHVAYLTSSTPTGPFTWQREDPQAFGYNLGDIDVYKDTDGSAYLVYTSDENGQNQTVGIAKLTSNYLGLDYNLVKFYEGSREAANILKRGSTYYLFTSGTQNWDSTVTKYRTATSLSGPWSSLTLLNTSPYSGYSFNTQADFVITVDGTQGTSYIYAGDRYSNFTGVGTGRVAWFPLTFDTNGVPTLNGHSNWFIDTVTGLWTAPTAPTNLILNGGFESGGATQTPTNWGEWSDNSSVDASYTNTSGPYAGSVKLVHKKSTAYRVSTSQTVGSLTNGLYTVKAYVQSSGGQTEAKMVAKNFGGTSMNVSIPTTSTWTQITIANINVTNGQCQIDFWSDAAANQWISVDHVELYKQ